MLKLSYPYIKKADGYCLEFYRDLERVRVIDFYTKGKPVKHSTQGDKHGT